MSSLVLHRQPVPRHSSARFGTIDRLGATPPHFRNREGREVLRVSPRRLVQYLVVQSQISHGSSQMPVLGLQLLEPPSPADPQPAVLRRPAIERLLGHPYLPAGLGNRAALSHCHVSQLQPFDHLLRRKLPLRNLDPLPMVQLEGPPGTSSRRAVQGHTKCGVHQGGVRDTEGCPTSEEPVPSPIRSDHHHNSYPSTNPSRLAIFDNGRPRPACRHIYRLDRGRGPIRSFNAG